MSNRQVGIIFVLFLSVKLAVTIALIGKEAWKIDTGKVEYFLPGHSKQGLNIARFSLVPISYAQQKNEVSSPEKPEFRSEIDLEILKSLEKKREELAKKEDEIKLKEEQLNLIQQNIQQKLNDLETIKSDIEKLILLRKDLEEKSINHMVKVYSAMSPAEAAAQIEKLDKDITIQILSRMKGKNAAKILGNINPALAAQISEQLVKKRPPKQPIQEQKK
ncbi:MAG: hypothetical protein HY578_10030 [Nitrospinae bacterium]|nr:hypothetical protein [Nitrospinota bacterium]